MARAKKKSTKKSTRKKSAKKKTAKKSSSSRPSRRVVTTTVREVFENQGRRYEPEEWVEFILDGDADALGYTDAEITPHLADKIREFEGNVHAYLKTVLPELGIEADPDDVFYDGDAPYNVLMTLRGEGVGIWDGRWDEYMTSDQADRLATEMRRDFSEISNDAHGGTLDIAFADAVFDTGTPLEENPCATFYTASVDGGDLVVAPDDDAWYSAFVGDDGYVEVIALGELEDVQLAAEDWAAKRGIEPRAANPWEQNPLSRDMRAALGAAIGAAIGGAWGAHASGTSGAGLGAAVGGLVGSYGAAHLAEIGGAFSGAARGVKEARGRELASKVEVKSNRRKR